MLSDAVPSTNLAAYFRSVRLPPVVAVVVVNVALFRTYNDSEL